MNITYQIRRTFNLENNIHFRIIEDDFKGIAKKIKQIDKNLYLVLNKLHNCFEIHDITQNITTYALTFDNLDSSIIDIIKKVKMRDTISIVQEQSYFKKRFEEQSENQMHSNYSLIANSMVNNKIS